MDSIMMDVERFTTTWAGPITRAIRAAVGAFNAAEWRGHPAGRLTLTYASTVRSLEGAGTTGASTLEFSRRMDRRWDEFVEALGPSPQLHAPIFVDFATLGIPDSAELVGAGAGTQVVALPAAETWRDRGPLL